MSFLISYFRNLNVFQAADGTAEDEFQKRSNIIATRVYLLLLVLTLVGLTVTLKFTTQTRQVTVEKPTYNQIKALPSDAQCPCSSLSISYETFLTLSASFHRICSSDFVSNRWIKALFFGKSISQAYLFNNDFRAIGSAQFQGLAGLCRLSSIYIADGLDSLYGTSLISSKLLSEELLKTTIFASIGQFKLTMPITFQSHMELINRMISSNLFFSGLQTSMFFWFWPADQDYPAEIGTSYADYYRYDGSFTNCLFDYDDATPAVIRKTSSNATAIDDSNAETIAIPGLFSGCMPINSLLQSTLECFYNQTCVDQILLFLPTNGNFTAMSPNRKSAFNVKSSIRSIVDQGMIEQWTHNISYDKYLAQCAPLSCTFSKAEQNGIMLVVTQIISLLSGITLMLSVLVPIVVQFIRNRLLKKELRRKTSLSVRIKQLVIVSKRYLVELNLFKNPSLADRYVPHQRLTTRLYVITVLTASIIVNVYLLLRKEVYHDFLLNPTEAQYHDLYEKFPDSLICTCASISVQYNEILTVSPVYHPICSNGSLLIDSAGGGFVAEPLFSLQSHLLRSFCEYAARTVNDSLRVFLGTQLVGSQVIARHIFDLEIDMFIDTWRSNVVSGFQRVLQLIRATNTGNELLNNRFNFQLRFDNASGAVTVQPFAYDGCSCAFSQTCQTFFFVEISTDREILDVNLQPLRTHAVGCHILEAMLRSTLTCLIDVYCVNHVNVPLAQPVSDDVLPTTWEPSWLITDGRFNNTGELIESIVSRMMVQAWLNTTSFASYYESCAPSSCTFEYISRSGIYFAVLKSISILGGSVTLIQLLTLTGIRLIEKIIEHNSKRNLLRFARGLFACPTREQAGRRLHFLLVLISLTAFYLTAFFPSQTTTVQIPKPSPATYIQAFVQHSTSLYCPCSKVSFQYSTFVSIQPRFHRICSSAFTSDDWIAYVYEKTGSFNRYNHSDFLRTAVGQYQLLISFCQLSEQTVGNAITQLDTTDHMSVQLMSPETLDRQIQTTIDTFRQRTPRLFLSVLSLIREITGANQLMSMYSTMWKYADVDLHAQGRQQLHAIPLEYDGCNCGLTSHCTQASRGMRAGCYPLEALLQSTLKCFYDQQCIDADLRFSALNFSSSSTRFAVNATVESLLQQLMVEEYAINKSYERYFAQCAPASCSYTYADHRETIDIATYIIGLYGGLVIICKVISVVIMGLCRRPEKQVRPQIWEK